MTILKIIASIIILLSVFAIRIAMMRIPNDKIRTSKNIIPVMIISLIIGIVLLWWTYKI